MISPQAPIFELNAMHAPVELHYWPQADIDAGRFTVALCGETAVPEASHAMGSSHRTSYACPDCMLRYSMLHGAS